MHRLRSRYHLDRYTPGKVTVLKQRYGAETAAASLLAPHSDRDGVLSIGIKDASRYRKNSLRPQVIDVNTHLPTVNKDQSPVSR